MSELAAAVAMTVLNLMMPPTIACESRPGTVVALVNVAGGDGNPIALKLTAGDTADFAIAGANVVVGPNGIARAHCAATQHVTVTASQP